MKKKNYMTENIVLFKNDKKYPEAIGFNSCGAAICKHLRQLSICAICAPAAEKRLK